MGIQSSATLLTGRTYKFFTNPTKKIKKNMAYKRTSVHYPDLPPSYESSVGQATTTEAYQKEGAPHPQQYQEPQQTIIVQYLPPPNFGHRSVKTTCPNCQALVWSRTRTEGS